MGSAHDQSMATSFAPLVRGATTTRDPNVSSLLRQLASGTYYVPDYQRDSSQWNISKRSLFVDSIINNMTIPPLIVYPETDPATGRERHQIVDGQQRLTTIRDFVNGVFALAAEDEVDYKPNIGPIIQGKKFAELPEPIREQIQDYTVNIVVLPKDLDLSLRLEIFRRINEAGLPLSPHDLRLAVFGQSDRVYLIRLAGIFDQDREGSRRMIDAAHERYGLGYPWKNPKPWAAWWKDSAHAVGQAPSQMFLYYAMARDLAGLNTLLKSDQIQQSLGVHYDKTTVSVLDLYAAQLQAESLRAEHAKLLSDMDTLRTWFGGFEEWFNVIKVAKVPSVPTNSSTKIAFFIAGAAQTWESPRQVTDSQWHLVHLFLTEGPGKIKEAIGLEYPITKGKWPRQQMQIEATFGICKAIAAQ